jgi:hypothetical protein
MNAFGPWAPHVDPTERIAQLRCLGGLATILLGSGHQVVAALRRAEVDHEAAAQALELLEQLPSRMRRNMLATFGSVTWPKRPSRRGAAP